MVSKNMRKNQWNIRSGGWESGWLLEGPFESAPTLRFYHALLRKNKEAEAEARRGNVWHLGYEVGQCARPTDNKWITWIYGVALLVAGGNGRCGLCPQRDQWEILESSVGLGKIAL